jgi:hypothetical protein
MKRSVTKYQDTLHNKIAKIPFSLYIGILMLVVIELSGCNYAVIPENSYKINLTYLENNLGECHYEYPYSDPKCSPGHAFPLNTIQVNGKYAQEPGSSIVGDICAPGYTKNVRHVTEVTKNKVYALYGIETRMKGEWVIDHIISLELGGDNNITNLYPQSTKDAHEKDKVENLLHDKVCAGEMTLQQAQYDIARNWTKYLVK